MSATALVINRIRILESVTLTAGRKLIKAALKAKRLKIQIGMEPSSMGEEEAVQANEHESTDHPASPTYYYYGADVRNLEHKLINEHCMLNCCAILSYGDGGMTVVDDEDAANALQIIQDTYRKPQLILYF